MVTRDSLPAWVVLRERIFCFSYENALEIMREFVLRFGVEAVRAAVDHLEQQLAEDDAIDYLDYEAAYGYHDHKL